MLNLSDKNKSQTRDKIKDLEKELMRLLDSIYEVAKEHKEEKEDSDDDSL